MAAPRVVTRPHSEPEPRHDDARLFWPVPFAAVLATLCPFVTLRGDDCHAFSAHPHVVGITYLPAGRLGIAFAVGYALCAYATDQERRQACHISTPFRPVLIGIVYPPEPHVLRPRATMLTYPAEGNLTRDLERLVVQCLDALLGAKACQRAAIKTEFDQRWICGDDRRRNN